MAVTSMTDVRSAVDEAIPLDYGPWLRASPQCRDFVGRLLQVGDCPHYVVHSHGAGCCSRQRKALLARHSFPVRLQTPAAVSQQHPQHTWCASACMCG
jgi:hypothetical protein